MADSETDPVQDLLMEIRRSKSGKKVDGKKIDAAMNYYDKMVTELNKLRPSKDDEDSKTQTAFDKCQQENVILKRELIEARNKLNALSREKQSKTGTVIQQVSEFNDPFRPSILAENFRSIYDDEWKIAFRELDKLKKNELQVLTILVNVIKGADQLCTAAMNQHLVRIEQVALEDLKLVKVRLPGNKDGTMMPDVGSVASTEETARSKRLIHDYIKSLGHLSIEGLLQVFDVHYIQPIKTENDISENLEKLDSLIIKLITSLWKMKMAEKPLVFVWQENGEPFSKNLSTFYKKTGNQVVQPVWPTVFSHQGGPILYKGIVVAE